MYTERIREMGFGCYFGRDPTSMSSHRRRTVTYRGPTLMPQPSALKWRNEEDWHRPVLVRTERPASSPGATPLLEG